MANRETFVTNGAETTLSSSLAAGATTINVTSTSAFPAIPFYAVIDPDVNVSREIILVDSAKTATTLALTAASSRGQDGTTDTAHSSGAKVVCVPVAALWTDVNDRIDAVPTDGYRPGGTDVAVADGGTGASTAAAARTNLAAASSTHAATHSNGGTDEVTVENLGTAATDTTLVLKPDGTGGVAFGAATGGGGAMTVIAESVLAADAATIAFSSIPATYRSLRLVVLCRVTAAATAEWLDLQMNGDTAGNYDTQRVIGENTTVSTSPYRALTAMHIGLVPGASAATGLAGLTVVEIAHYAGTTFQKNVRSNYSLTWGTATSEMQVGDVGGLWRSTAAVSSLTLKPGTGNFLAGSVATLYGITGL